MRYLKQREGVQCANCGGCGHIYKQCNHPVTSYGIICYRLKVDSATNTLYPEYLMVQRKDSFCYVEFLRGKYSIDNRSYMLSLLSNMTPHERQLLVTRDFEELWKDLWQVHDCNNFVREYHEAKRKFNTLSKGYYMKMTDGALVYIDLKGLMQSSCSVLPDTEWGFPKGRRNINESDLSCALREFSEETTIPSRHIQVLRNTKPLEEVFMGSNRVRYRHLYYLACLAPSMPPQSQHHSADNRIAQQAAVRVQLREVKNMAWLKYHEAQANIQSCNIERKELFKRANQIILRNICLANKGRQQGQQPAVAAPMPPPPPWVPPGFHLADKR